MAANRIFRVPITEEEEKKALDNSTPKSTRYATKWALKIFSAWQTQRSNKDPANERCSFTFDVEKVQSLDTNICNMSPESLNLWLAKFVQEVNKTNGQRYPPRSLYLIVTGLQRHLKESGNPVSLLGQKEGRLNMFRRILDAEMKQATQDGVAKKSKKEERNDISGEEELHLWNRGILGCHTAKSLFRTIYFYNGKLFGLRAKEHRSLRYSNFRVVRNCVIYDESVSKTYHGGLKDLKYKPRVVKHVCCEGKEVNHFPCLVNCYAKYLENIKHLSDEIEAFYFKPNPNLEEFSFCRAPVGVNTLNKVLPELCAEAGLSRKTSHCLRITCATRLFQSHTEEKLIRERTGHRSNALLGYEKANKEQELKASAAVGPPKLSTTDNECSNNDDMLQDLFDLDLVDFDIPDDILMNVPETSSDTSALCATGSVFNNCTFNFGK